MKESKTHVFVKQTILNYIFQAISVLISIFSIPLYLQFLGKKEYGIWVTLLAIISWVQMTDFGISHGLRNKLTIALARRKILLAKKYISSSYISVARTSAAVTLILLLLIPVLSVKGILYQWADINTNLTSTFIVLIVGFGVNFVLGVCNSIYYALQKSFIINLKNVVANVIPFIFILLARKFGYDSSIFTLAVIHFVGQTISNLLFSVYLFRANRELMPALKYYRKEALLDIRAIGVSFFVIQVCSLFLYTSDFILIAHFIDVESVTDYSLVAKVYGTGNMIFSIVLVALWSSITDAFAKGNHFWIKKIVRTLRLLFIPFSIVTMVVTILLPNIILLWTGLEYKADTKLSWVFCFYTIVIAWSGINVNVLNGLGMVKRQMVVNLMSAVILVPLCVVMLRFFPKETFAIKFSILILSTISTLFLHFELNRYFKLNSIAT